ncbi:hypothetical protein B4U80_05853 [Leptotrombidium deliense]|uniref:Uncharacterized protein n=1 Tax=Leptotrombidium deliense TaxID=299467 RepID=A0A443Q7G8_9ACAR|nr:hypothetical protein B4U80_05853 [Leptotrombidium deliense]
MIRRHCKICPKRFIWESLEFHKKH